MLNEVLISKPRDKTFPLQIIEEIPLRVFRPSAELSWPQVDLYIG